MILSLFPSFLPHQLLWVRVNAGTFTSSVIIKNCVVGNLKNLSFIIQCKLNESTGLQNMIWDRIQGHEKSMLLMKKKSVMFRSQNDYVELGEKVFWCSRHRTPATLFFTDQMLGLLNYKSEELKICPSKRVISDYKISLHIMLFIPLKRFSLSITVSVKKCFWRWCLDIIINIIIMNFHNWKMTEVLQSPTKTRKLSPLSENLHFIPEGTCIFCYILSQTVPINEIWLVKNWEKQGRGQV